AAGALKGLGGDLLDVALGLLEFGVEVVELTLHLRQVLHVRRVGLLGQALVGLGVLGGEHHLGLILLLQGVGGDGDGGVDLLLDPLVIAALVVAEVDQLLLALLQLGLALVPGLIELLLLLLVRLLLLAQHGGQGVLLLAVLLGDAVLVLFLLALP